MNRPQFSETCSALVLAGGASTRMGGVDKCLLPYDGQPMIERVFQVVGELFSDIILLEGEAGRYSSFDKVRRVADLAVGQGPMGGILTGLEACRCPWGFVVAADMPRVNAALVRRIVGSIDESVDAVVPVFRGKMEPLHAAYSRRLIDGISSRLEKGRRKTYELFNEGNTRFVEISEDELSYLQNVNTPEDLERR